MLDTEQPLCTRLFGCAMQGVRLTRRPAFPFWLGRFGRALLRPNPLDGAQHLGQAKGPVSKTGPVTELG
jgi:hypothetical protein